jgi:hypothetical protein
VPSPPAITTAFISPHFSPGAVGVHQPRDHGENEPAQKIQFGQWVEGSVTIMKPMPA